MVACQLLRKSFLIGLKISSNLHEQNIKNIFIDFHAEATSEKNNANDV